MTESSIKGLNVEFVLAFDLILEFSYFVSYDSNIENQAKAYLIIFLALLCVFWILNLFLSELNFCCVKNG